MDDINTFVVTTWPGTTLISPGNRPILSRECEARGHHGHIGIGQSLTLMVILVILMMGCW